MQDRTLRIHGKCLPVSGSAKVDGSKTVLEPCAGYASQQWAVGSVAQLINGTAGNCLAGSSTGHPASGLCLADPGDATGSGTAAVVASCVSGDPGQGLAGPLSVGALAGQDRPGMAP